MDQCFDADLARCHQTAAVHARRRPTHSFPEAEFEVLYRLNVKRRKKWLSQFVAEAAVAAA